MKKNINKKLFGNQSGQGMSEYTILLVTVAMGCIFLWKTLPEAVRAYMQAFYYCISRVFP